MNPRFWIAAHHDNSFEDAAQNPEAPAPVLRFLLDEGERSEEVEPRLLTLLAHNPATPSDVVGRLLQSPSPNIAAIAAAHSAAPPGALAEAAGSRYIQVRSNVAGNSRTPAQTLAELAGDAEREVRKSVAENPNIPAATATRLADDEYWLVKYNLAKVTKDPKVLRKLAKADKHLIRTAVARNAKTPANVRQQLAQDEVPKVAQAAQAQG